VHAASRVLTELGVSHRRIRLSETSALTDDELTVVLPRHGTVPELDLVSAFVPFQCLAPALALARSLSPERMRFPDLSTRPGITSSGTNTR